MGQTVRCVCHFMSMTEGDTDKLVDLLARHGLFLNSKIAPSTQAGSWISQHATFDKHSNMILRDALVAHPVWGPSIRKVREVAAAIFARQSALYGCVPPESLSATEDARGLGVSKNQHARHIF